MKRVLFIVLCLFMLLIGTTTIEAETGVRYHTYTMSNNRLVRTQTAYIPVASSDRIYDVDLGEPNDIHVDRNNTVYIVSTMPGGFGRLIVFDLETEEASVYGEEFLVNPTGVYVSPNQEIYIADRGGRKAYRLNQDGTILQSFERPVSPIFGDGEFQPRKIVADSRGNAYILNRGTRGLAQFSRNGDFLGYYGTNTIAPTLRTILQYTFFTQEQLSRLFSLSPPEIANMAVDQRGLIHTVSLGVENYGVKRLNISGDNLLPAMFNAPNLVDVFVGPIGNIYTITTDGIIYEYDREGNLLFMFGGQDVSNQVQGLFNLPSAIAVDSDYNIFVLDRAAGELQVFMPTRFANMVHQALETYQDGDYIASQEPWSEVLKMNDFFDLAHRGMGNAHFSLGNFDDALEAYRIAYDREGYSEAFWEVRNAWLLQHAPSMLTVFFVVIVLYIINLKAKFSRVVTNPLKQRFSILRKKVRTLDEVLYVFTYLRNPADASYFIKRRNRVSMFSATLLLGIFFLFYVFYIYQLSFLFNMRIIQNINLTEELIKIFLPFGLWVLANTLIGSIREGEGRFKDVYITTIFSLAPFFLILPILTIMSQVLTYNEAFLMEFVMFIAIGVTVIYFFFMVKETHYYTVKETFQSIAISAFTMAMLILGTFIIYILLNELFALIRDIVMEVFYRV